jgi:hypothetical protein
MKTRDFLAAAAAALAVSPSIASASVPTVGPISTSLFASGDGPENGTYGILSNSASDPGGSQTSDASIFYSGGGMTLTSGATAQGGDLVGSSEADGTFYFEAIGPSGTVPMDFSALGTTNVTGPGGLADADIEVQFGSLAKLVACSSSTVSDCTGFSSGFSGAVHFDVNANQVYQVDLTTHCLAAANLVQATTCSAMIDPMPTINPNFIDKGLYSLVFSPNVAGPGPVPEPASWAVMLIGLFGLGALRRTRRRATARA